VAEVRKTSFHYFGVGCLIVGVVLVLVAAVLGFGFFRWARDVKSVMKDPQSREQKVLHVLGSDGLPPGYNAMIGVTIPFFMEMAMLTDRAPVDENEVPELGKRGLIYLSMRNFGRDRQELDDFFNGRSEDPEVLRKNNIDLDLDERVAMGQIDRSTGPVLWVSHRGQMISGRAQGRHDGLVTLLQIHCSADDRNRLGIWFGPAPSAGDSDEPASLTGSIAEEAQVAEFVDHFRFCPS